MHIVFGFGEGVNDYLQAVKTGYLHQLDRCPVCQTAGRLVKHGVYWRKPRDGERVYRLPIQRWWCKACQHTISVLPDFLLRFRWYLVGVISEVLVARAEQGTSWSDLQEEAAGAPHVRTMQRWWASLGRQAVRWLGAIQTFLAEQDSGSSWLDPQGEAAQSLTTMQALLSVAGHLLAWAKSHWAELARYGWNDRLRFLWLWGSGRGMQRLV